MSSHNEIVLTAEPRGNFLEGIVSGTPKPGTIMQIDASVAEVGGRFTWEVYDAAADGNRRMIAILLPDQLRGKLTTDAYVDGDRCFLYVPLPGDEVQVLYKNVAGTADDVAVGDLLIVDDGTGKVIVTTGTPESEPFQALEAITDPTEDQLVRTFYTGY